MSIAVELAASRGVSGGFEAVAMSRTSERALGLLAITVLPENRGAECKRVASRYDSSF
jgi:hypothetical protein